MMSMYRVFGLTGIAVVAFSGVAQAIERLTPIKEPEALTESTPKSSEQVWLGVAGKPVNEALAAQLGIKNGVTLELVDRSGSAAKGGIKKWDVITQVGGHPIKEMNDLRAAIKNIKVGEVVEVEVFSVGKREVKKVQMEARPRHLAQMREVPQRQKKQRGYTHLPQAFKHLPHADQQRIEQMMQARIQQMEQRFSNVDKNLLDIRKLQEEAMKGGAQGGNHFSNSFTIMDEHGSVRITENGDSGKQVEVKDQEGKVLYSGPYETDKDKEAVPQEVRARIDAVSMKQTNKKGGFQFFFGR